jgi:hypothetical protein
MNGFHDGSYRKRRLNFAGCREGKIHLPWFFCGESKKDPFDKRQWQKSGDTLYRQI